MTTDTEWYVAMGEAVKERNRALSMADNWREKAQAAEVRITTLAQQGPGAQTPEAVQEQPQEQ